MKKDDRRILFVTGTRADFGKLKPLLTKLKTESSFDLRVFTTGMHMLSRHGSTWHEVSEVMKGDLHPFMNQGPGDSMDQVLGKTILGLSDFTREFSPDLIVVHGDRVEALAGAIVGSLNNILVAHIEGGEVSGTIDDSMRHAITKLSHIHFVSNDSAAQRVIRMGEDPKTVHIIGSPEVDILSSPSLPSVESAKAHYDIDFETYSIVILHPVTTEIENVSKQTSSLLEFMQQSAENFVVIESNNDSGSDEIFALYSQHPHNTRIKFFPSMRFELFLSLLKSARCIIGNSSSGVREAPFLGVPAVNLGTRQANRSDSPLVFNADFVPAEISKAFQAAIMAPRIPHAQFGKGGSADKFVNILKSNQIWGTPLQKVFSEPIQQMPKGDAK
jgi:UDP-N-acetylglucosamine 2-epimerase (hydrolysing)